MFKLNKYIIITTQENMSQETTQAPTREQIMLNLNQQIEVRELQSRLQALNTALAVEKFKELEAQYNIGKIMQASQPQQVNQEKYLEHVVTEEDLKNNPQLAAEGIKIGQTIMIPRELVEQPDTASTVTSEETATNPPVESKKEGPKTLKLNKN